MAQWEEIIIKDTQQETITTNFDYFPTLPNVCWTLLFRKVREKWDFYEIRLKHKTEKNLET